MKKLMSIWVVLSIIFTLAGCNSSVSSPSENSIPNSVASKAASLENSNGIESAETIEPNGSVGETDNLVGLEINQQNYDSHNELFRSIYDTVVPYMTTNAYYNLSYPDFQTEYQQCLLMYVGYGITEGHFESSFAIADYLDNQTGIYTIPKDLFDEVVKRHLGNITLDDDYLVENGYLLQDKSAYTISLDGFGLAGWIYIGDLKTYDDGKVELRLDVAFTEEQAIEMSINFVLAYYTTKEYLTIIEIY